MKKRAEIIEVENEGFVGLLGRKVMITCMRYIYAGTLEGVNDTCIKLANSQVVFDTGPYNTIKSNGFQTAEKAVSDEQYIQLSAIESFCVID